LTNLLLRRDLLLRELRNLFCNSKSKRAEIVWLIWMMFLPVAVFVPQAGCDEVAVESLSATSKVESTPSGTVEEVCSLIYQGKFDAADELIEQSSRDSQSRLEQVSQIIREYKSINQRRSQAWEAKFEEHLSKLEEFRVAADTNDVNDVNDISSILSVIASVREFADKTQTDMLLSDPFVKRTIEETIDKASTLESEGKWLDTYICYSWLQAIDKDNDAYSDYAKQILDKAHIADSFEDTPCETSQKRYEGVEKKIFVRAIDTLNNNYVSIIDYRQMATKACRRCKLLAEVISSSPALRDSLHDSQADISDVQYDRKLSVFSAEIDTLLDEVGQSPTGMDKNGFMDVFEKVLELNTATVQFPQPVLISHFTEAAFSTLDRYTVMVWPRQVQDFDKMMSNKFTGIGVEITKAKGLLKVASLLLDTPAYNSGLDAGDVIEKVDGTPTKDMSLTCAVKRITGPKGTRVTLTIRSPGAELPHDITITRDRIIVPTIRGWQRTETGKWLYMIDDEHKIGYVRITSFSSETAGVLEEALSQLESEGVKGLILDLRFNTGGLLDSAVEVADKFLKEGMIVRTQPKWGMPVWKSAHEKNTHPNYPLVLLINRHSASASEIVAGALADKVHNRAILVGERTHGKGSVQGITTRPGGGAQLKYTMAYYHLPSGQRVESQDVMKKQGRNDWGVQPHIEVKLKSNELVKISDLRRDNDVLVRADHDVGNAPLKRHKAEEIIEADPQLAVGILVIKSKLLQADSLVSSAN